MKKALLIILALLVLTACGDGAYSMTEQTEKETDADGNWIKRGEFYSTIYADKLPCVLPYNEKNIIVQKLNLYQTEYNYEHYLVAVADIDLSGLSNKDFHWIFEDKELEYHAFVDGGENKFELEQMGYLGAIRYTDTKMLKVGWIVGTFKKCRYGFDGTEVGITVSAKQKEGLPYDVFYTVDADGCPEFPNKGEENYSFITQKLDEKTKAIYKMME